MGDRDWTRRAIPSANSRESEKSENSGAFDISVCVFYDDSHAT